MNLFAVRISGFASVLLFVLALCSAFSSVGEGHRSVSIVYTTDTQGYLYACGCSGQYTGGLVRRSTLISNLRKENPSCIVVESGNLMPMSKDGKRDMRLLETVCSALKMMGYDAVGVGRFDLAYGRSFYEQFSKQSTSVLQVDADLPSGVKSYIVMKVNGVRVGILSFGMTNTVDSDVARARLEAYKTVRGQCDVLVILDQSNTVTAKWLGELDKKYGSPDIVIGDALRNTGPDPVYIGRTMIVPTSKDGEYVGCLDVDVIKDNKTIKFTRVIVDSKIPNDPQIQSLIDDYGEHKLEPFAPSQKKPLNLYSSYKSCKNCHELEFERWQTTTHAKALVSLLSKGSAAPRCLVCHSEKYRATESLALGEDDLQAVECSSCHSDVPQHKSKPKKVDVDYKTKCLTCHTPEHSPNFNYSKAIKQIKHKGH